MKFKTKSTARHPELVSGPFEMKFKTKSTARHPELVSGSFEMKFKSRNELQIIIANTATK